MTGIATTLATIWRLAAPYFRSEDRAAGRALLAAVIAIELAIVAINYQFNLWYERFYNSLQDRNWNTFIWELGIFSVLAGAFIGLAVYQLYLNQWLQIRWRRWMTGAYLDTWLAGSNHYRMQLLGDAADNPDQRIAEDIQMFVERTLTIGLGLLNAILTLAAFTYRLWTLSSTTPVYLWGAEFVIPGYLVWVALVYAVVGTFCAHWIGWPLISLYFNQQRYEADFRFNLVRTRENSEQIALLAGEPVEKRRLLDRFANVVSNWLQIMQRVKKLTFFTAGYNQVSVIFPYVVVSPAYFAGKIQLGVLPSTANAFNSVQTALSFFITAYRQIAEWRAVIERLTGFAQAAANARTVARTPPVVEVVPADGRNEMSWNDLAVHLPSGEPLLASDDMVVNAGERVLVTGPSGAGKSTLFRAIAGIWPFGRGRILIPKNARVMLLPQRPYFPIGTLAAAIAYPAHAEAFDDGRLLSTLRDVGLGALAPRLHEEAHWNRTLSLGEQQRLAIARALLQSPDVLFLDEATASLDEASESALYRLLNERLKSTTIVSIGHRATLNAFHRRKVSFAREGERYRLREAALSSAAE
ncbi:MAG TPA: ABC transporter ATP-binding protein/permease [Xanthobacteraceae bacterium]|nr:ABC transporter ATP-binding protein/permease [Xanthobacteraceae bacterium]